MEPYHKELLRESQRVVARNVQAKHVPFTSPAIQINFRLEQLGKSDKLSHFCKRAAKKEEEVALAYARLDFGQAAKYSEGIFEHGIFVVVAKAF